jgi:hypothetical protein
MMPWNGCSKSSHGSSQKIKKKKERKELDPPVLPEVAVLSCGHPCL